MTFQVRNFFATASHAPPWENTLPIRAELFGAERLEEYGRTLALSQPVAARGRAGRGLSQRLADNEAVLFEASRTIAQAIDSEHAGEPAAEWLVDNYHLVEEQIREVRLYLPAGYYRQLPKLAYGPFAGYPRIFGLAWGYVAHTDSHFDPDLLCRFVAAYQSVQPLTIGELWALAVTLRSVLIENLRRLAESIVISSSERQLANELADRLLDASERPSEPVAKVLPGPDSEPPSVPFAVQLLRRLHDADPRLVPALAWLDDRLAAQGTRAEAVVHEEHQRQGAANVTVRNIITSMHLIAEVDWKVLVERMSLVDRELEAGGRFAEMDFPTRNLYRAAIETLARGVDSTEVDVARRAVEEARTRSAAGAAGGRHADPGYDLIAEGRAQFEKLIGYRSPLGAWLGSFGRSLGIASYVTLGAVVAGVVLALPLLALAGLGIAPLWLVALAVLGLIPAMDVAVALVNQAITRSFGATVLPALALKDGIPGDLRTLIAVPTLLTSENAVIEQIQRLEIHYLASGPGALHFAIVSDWADAPSEHMPDDDHLLALATKGIADLNRRYGPAEGGDRFLLLHRRRLWSQREGRWMGWERKRGKLHELNRLLRGATDTNFLQAEGGASVIPAGVRYVITLDSDTRLPRDTVRRLIGKMAHPLNQPLIDRLTGRVIEGYGVMQPRVSAALPANTTGSLYQRVFSSSGGIDPYAAAVSDVYQDLFGEGSYVGKGIYDVDAFETALAGRVPDGAILSHDLFEGVFVRAGLVSDIEVVEDFPTRYDVAALRSHRWARGDWQLLPWVLGLGPLGPDRRWTVVSMPPNGRWKMLDNLRRTLSAPMAVVALLAGWLLPLEAALIWSAFILAAIIAPTVAPIVADIFRKGRGVTIASHLRAVAADFRLAAAQSALLIALLPHQAALMADAIVRTLYRLYISRRHLLEWVTTAQVSGRHVGGLAGFYRQMYGAVVIGGAALAVAVIGEPSTRFLALSFAVLGVASPLIAWSVSRSVEVAAPRAATADDLRVLQLTARRTWRFFETFVTPADNMLPPDNFQEDAAPVVAHRTSPTNLGMYLLTVASASDLGWIGLDEAVERLEATLATMERMDRFRGHFYNWYDTRDLRILNPPYVSAVDSGNLAGHLVALANACARWREIPAVKTDPFAGIVDALEIAGHEADVMRKRQGSGDGAGWRCFDEAHRAFAEALARARESDDASTALAELSAEADRLVEAARAAMPADAEGDDLLYWSSAMARTIASKRRDLCTDDASALISARIAKIERGARAMALAMDFSFLLDPVRNLLTIGYVVSEGRTDASCYDLLASEARLASFMAIAKGDVPASQWFRLGRPVTQLDGEAALISWSGSMFEYLMPSLVMRAPPGSLIERTNELVVRRQIDYATKLGIPWGISESAYNVRDRELTYQYSNFGVPGLGLKRGLEDNIVIAPYATGLAAMVDPHSAARNFSRLAGVGGLGRYGYYEALDYTPARVPEGHRKAVVRAYMAHHQGMTVVAIANTLLDGRMRARFHAEPMVQASELLLQERAPRDVAQTRPLAALPATSHRVSEVDHYPSGRRFTTPHLATPATNILSNDRYAVMVTAAGSGYSTWNGLAVTRWREDATCDDWGSYVFLRDIAEGDVWSAGYQPQGSEPDAYYVEFKEDRAEFARRDGKTATGMEVLLSSEFDAEVRRVTVVNSTNHERVIEFTSYAELVLAPQAADIGHPAFSKMFVRTESLADLGAVLATRRQRSPDEPSVWAAQICMADGETVGALEVETDRARFLGRGRTLRTAAAMTGEEALSGTVGDVLDPIFALRRRVRLAPGATARVSFWTMVADSRDNVIGLIDKLRDSSSFERASMLSWTQAQVQLHHLGINRAEAGLFQRLAGHVIYATPAMRASSERIRRGAGQQPGLWKHGISGDLPIVLLRISSTENLDVVHQLLRAHEYWRMRLLAADLVIVNEHGPSYVQDLQEAITTMVQTSLPGTSGRPPGGGKVHVLRADLIAAEDRELLVATARVVIVAARGRLSEQLERASSFEVAHEPPLPARSVVSPPATETALPELEMFNGLGGFADDGREYVTVLEPGLDTPAPWINVIANPAFGFQVAAEGSGYTWAGNSRDNQLTPWSNDAVADRPGEAFYLRDEDSGALWCPTAAPIRLADTTYIARHGWGYSTFEAAAHGVSTRLTQFVAIDEPVKLSRLTLRNDSRRRRRLSVTAFVEWVLGPSRQASLAHVITEIDAETGAMFARNPWNEGFGRHIAFIDAGEEVTEWTADRREFIGRNGTLAQPAAQVGRQPLAKKAGAGIDPCGAVRRLVEVAANESVDVVVLLGQADSIEEARRLVRQYRAADADEVLARVKAFWKDTLGSVQVTTPDRASDIMLNGWLMYQSLACRIWARSAFYQASGAYGFRDQLQDMMAHAASRPDMVRRHLLRAAGRQFLEGDVQHWWLPHSGQGVRTRISDDRAWLAHCVAHYIAVTGDATVLEESVPFIEGPQLPPGAHDSFFMPEESDMAASLYEHCARALDHSLATGTHGLPLMGTGDWNDSMNRVGENGKGESVWLGWLLHAALTAFVRLAKARGDAAHARKWRNHASRLAAAIERHAWDGDWYKRAWFDSGEPLGSAANEECRIDSIAQAWAVISGAAPVERAALAMASVEHELIDRRNRLALLFKPPFEATPLEPGYIKAYPPGVRENGGQYTHAAIWTAIAFAILGEGDKAFEVFSLLNPLNHARDLAGTAVYKVEPYVVAADIYSTPPHLGRGGWTWYTGSASWMQRAGIESILGLGVRDGELRLSPCIPRAWKGFRAVLRHGSARYEIVVDNPKRVTRGIARLVLDGAELDAAAATVPLADDGRTHRVKATLA